MTCIAAVSGGPDSMAMTDLLVQQGIRPILAHVNYQKRPTADRDEQIVREYAARHNLEVRVLYPTYPGGNFQAWARDVRYAFFEEIARDVQADVLYVAHQQDDLLETYLIQKQRGILPQVYGLAPEIQRHTLKVCRPLLSLSKAQLEDYCQSHQIVYGIDESNLENTYLRNTIRHEQIQTLDSRQRNELLEEIRMENEQLACRRQKAAQFFESHPAAALYEQPEAEFLLDFYLSGILKKHYARSHLQEILRQSRQGHPVELDGWLLEKHGSEFLLDPLQTWQPIVLESMEQLQSFAGTSFGAGKEIYRIFSLQDLQADPSQPLPGKEQQFSVQACDFPLEIAPAKAGEQIEMRFGRKKISRIYIDKKVPHIQRRQRPIIHDKDGKPIYVPENGCERSHFDNGQTFFMVKS